MEQTVASLHGFPLEI